jgi:hypothetical protein
MNQSGMTIPNAILMTLIGGATLGGFVVALTGMKSAKELRNGLLALVGRPNPRAGRSGLEDAETVRVAFI